MDDPHDLRRFVDAQRSAYDRALRELQAGRKTSHWMWYVFPQLRGLGFSETAQFYGISGLDEAVAYLAHPILGPRLRACVEAMLAIEGRTAADVLGDVDGKKFRSSMTLFAHAAPQEAIFAKALEKFFAGEEDARTLAMLREGAR
ncbi:DUF1810 domain-containing protein [Methylocystis sp. WRRC1]|uniref:DUF1810 domain-containing protein n=1 Tax=Methylocystis sp. WRRC1 TaxID=1732014 RepID=UPI001D137553|nr:DUF1810 domain-containing protein [Methylocystis sp. WRRC1]MCC3246326.1 DUF1810 domain-containing protein [Methylocystis sp. WRRC1]